MCAAATAIPLSHELAWYNLQAVPALADVSPTGSIYASLGELGMRLTHCEQWIEATMPTPMECEIFGFSAPRPCLLIKRKSFETSGTMIEYVEGLFAATPTPTGCGWRCRRRLQRDRSEIADLAQAG